MSDEETNTGIVRPDLLPVAARAELPADASYRDPDVLELLYYEYGLDQHEIGDAFGMTNHTISRWMCKGGINPNPLRVDEYRNAPWRDRDRLEKLYVEQHLTVYEIASRWDTTPGVIAKWLSRYDITQRPGCRGVSQYVDRGYVRYAVYEGDLAEKGCGQTEVYEHQLVALLNSDPADVFAPDMHVHHENGIRWDNRPTNIRVLTASEHTTEHVAEMHRARDYSHD